MEHESASLLEALRLHGMRNRSMGFPKLIWVFGPML
jgi:hypothetical protein